jgi:hypothetical protein
VAFELAVDPLLFRCKMTATRYPFHSALRADSGLVGRSPLDRAGRARPASDAQVGASARASSPALHYLAGNIWLSHGDTHLTAFSRQYSPSF